MCFSGSNQKPERRRLFGTGLVRHCLQGLFSPFFTFLRATFFRPFRLSLVPTICPWVSEDEPSKVWEKVPTACDVSSDVVEICCLKTDVQKLWNLFIKVISWQSYNIKDHSYFKTNWQSASSSQLPGKKLSPNRSNMRIFVLDKFLEKLTHSNLCSFCIFTYPTRVQSGQFCAKMQRLWQETQLFNILKGCDSDNAHHVKQIICRW